MKSRKRHTALGERSSTQEIEEKQPMKAARSMAAARRLTAGSVLGTKARTWLVFAALIPAASTAAFGLCPNVKGIGSFLQSPLVSASLVSDGTFVTYTFDSLVDTSPVNGVPGLISYCVYPPFPPGNPNSVNATAVGADSTPFQYEFSVDHFDFTRGNGNPTNIPLDGTSGITMGNATWPSGLAPGTQTILLHINDADECDRLYGGNPGTCFVFPAPPIEAKPPTVLKSATPSFNRAFGWTIKKSVDKTLVEQVGGTATFNYTVTVTHDSGTDSNWQVQGNIVVSNPNGFAVTVDVTDAIDNGGVCTVTGGAGATVPGGSVPSPFPYICIYPLPPSPPIGTNTATITWAKQGSLEAGTASYSVPNIDFSTTVPNLSDNCVAVTDTFAGALGTVCVGGTNPTPFTYSRTIPVPQFNCLFFPNTATFTTNTTGTTGSSGATVEVCGPAKTGALTMGFWQNKNGQAIITGQAKLGVCPSGTWLRLDAPFQDLSATATCSQVATYVFNVIKAASASGPAMNAMLKAQMLATALDVYFSDPGLGGNKIGAPAPIGGVVIDLTMICKMIDGTGGTATCSGTYENTTAAFGGTPSLQSVSQILAYAASQSTAGGSVWYGQVKATQELAKNTFDAINNQVAFSP
jgi:hypothetical protein